MAEIEKLKVQLERAQGNARQFKDRWDNFLDLAYSRLVSEGGEYKSRIKDGSLAAVIYERACRVAAQPATGKIYALSRHDEGKTQLINLYWQRYCIPRMNWQYSFATKLRLWEYYSLIYGVMPMFHGYHVDDNYVGPDCKLVNPQFVHPQAGRLSPNDADYIFLETFHSLHSLKKQIGQDGWKSGALKELIEKAKEDITPDIGDRVTNMQQARGEDTDLYRGQVKLVTKYKRGYGESWVTFAPDYDLVVREIKNPFKSGQIPVKFKYAMPLIDSFWGLGDIERGESLQRGIDTSINLAMDYMKLMLFPPTLFSNTMNLSQYKMRPGAKWKVSDSAKVSPLQLSQMPPQIQQQIYQSLKGGILNQNGTTDTAISGNDKLPGYGKSPQALKKLGERENSRDSWDREMLEEAEAELFNGMLEELSIHHNPEVEFHIFNEEIEQIAEAGFIDVLDVFDSAVEYWVDPATKEQVENPAEAEIKQRGLIPKLNGGGTAKLTIKPEALEAEYYFNVDTNSTAANDEAEEFERLEALMNVMGTEVAQKGVEALQQAGKSFDFGALLSQYIKGSQIKGGSELIKEASEAELQQMQNQEQEPPEDMPAPEIGEADMSGGEDFSPEQLQNPQFAQMLEESQRGGGDVY